jgi:cytochrome P450
MFNIASKIDLSANNTTTHSNESPTERLAAVHELDPKIRAAANEIERGRLPSHIVRDMQKAGVFRMTMPRAWGLLTRPVNLRGVSLPAGAKLLLWLSTSGPDASIFPDPEVPNLSRATAPKALAFRKGIHYWVGSALGKLQAQLALEDLIKRFPRLRLVAGKAISFPANMCFRGPQELWVQGA